MEPELKPDRGLDEHVASYLLSPSQRISRSGILTLVGKTLLRLSGLALIPLLPLDRRSTVYATGSCSWETCGMCGTMCQTSSACCSNSGGFSSCPNCSGMTKNGGWSLCCYNTALGECHCDAGLMFTYYDCCGTGTIVNTCKSSVVCQDHPTGNCSGQGEIAYCPSGKSYSCTIVVTGGACNACSNGVQPPSHRRTRRMEFIVARVPIG